MKVRAFRDIKREMAKAQRSATNKLMRKASVAASKKVREVYVIKARDLKQFTKIRRASGSRSTATLIITGSPIGLIHFGPKQVRRGVSVRIKKTSGRKVVKSAFIEVMPSGHIGVFQRVGKGRLPIKELKTLSPIKMYEVEGVRAFENIVLRDARTLLNREMKYYMGRAFK